MVLERRCVRELRRAGQAGLQYTDLLPLAERLPGYILEDRSREAAFRAFLEQRGHLFADDELGNLRCAPGARPASGRPAGAGTGLAWCSGGGGCCGSRACALAEAHKCHPPASLVARTAHRVPCAAHTTRPQPQAPTTSCTSSASCWTGWRSSGATARPPGTCRAALCLCAASPCVRALLSRALPAKRVLPALLCWPPFIPRSCAAVSCRSWWSRAARSRTCRPTCSTRWEGAGGSGQRWASGAARGQRMHGEPASSACRCA